MLETPSADLFFILLSAVLHSSFVMLSARLLYISLLTFLIGLYVSTHLLGRLFSYIFLLWNCFIKCDLTLLSTSLFSVSRISSLLLTFITLSTLIFFEDLSSRLLSIYFNSPWIASHHMSMHLFIFNKLSFFCSAEL